MSMKLDASKFIYCPLLKAKLGEYSGAHDVGDELKPSMLPVFVAPPASDRDHENGRPLVPAEHVRLFGQRLFNSWGKRPVLVDAVNLDDEWHRSELPDHPLTALLQRARSAGTIAIPMTGMTRSREYQLAVRHANAGDKLGVGLRLRVRDFDADNLHQLLNDVFSQLMCGPEDTFLFVDFENRNFGSIDDFVALLIDRLNHLPYLSEWRLVAVAGTEFPEKISVTPRQKRSYRRGEWHVMQGLLARRSEIIRFPIFSDYVIEHPAFGVGGGRGVNIHLRYTSGGNWEVFKGEKFKDVGYSGIFDVADSVCQSEHFVGPDFSEGDRMIFQWANREIKSGSASSWRQAGVCHHMTFVARQFGPLIGVSVPERSPAVTPETQYQLYPAK